MTENTGPHFVGPPKPADKLAWAGEAEGKTIASVEFGATEYPLVDTSHIHRSEMMVLHFTDGTSLTISVGSNIWDLFDELQAASINPSRITTSLIPHLRR